MNETFKYYNQNADSFIEGTLETDMRKVQEQFLKYLPKGAHILDAGCGSGRDSLQFLDQGYRVTAIDGSEELCHKASKLIGQDVKQQYFQDIDEIQVYDGIWACATLLHIPSTEIQEVMEKMINALKVEGVFYMSFKYGEFEGMRNGRYFTDYTEDSLLAVLNKFEALEIVEKWITADARADRDEKWINVIARKI